MTKVQIKVSEISGFDLPTDGSEDGSVDGAISMVENVSIY
jgi:hypothetical protein